MQSVWKAPTDPSAQKCTVTIFLKLWSTAEMTSKKICYMASPRKRKTHQNINIRGYPAIQTLEEWTSALNGDGHGMYVGV